METKVGRPPSDRKKVQLSLKINPDLYEDLLDLVAVNHSDKTKMIEQCLKLGMPAFIKEEKLENKICQRKLMREQKEPKKRAV